MSSLAAKVSVGLTEFVKKPGRAYKKARLGLLANQASVGPGYRHAVTLIDQACPGRLKVLFSPQHGFAGEKQDNMVESSHRRLGGQRPLYSLYGPTRRPTPQMLAETDVLLIDLADVGSRIYTFAQTMAYCLEEAGRLNKEVLILDRPNPIGGLEVEGNLLAEDCRSFVGLYPLPMRHGLTMGELALYINHQLPRPAPLRVVELKGWRRGRYFNETGLPWVYPSPNMPEPATAWVYPGQVIWEGTNISEGRGTTRPFHLCGAPFIEPAALKAELKKLGLPGVVFRPAVFLPTFHKWAGQDCGGLEIHPVSKDFKPYLTSLSILEIILKLWPGRFKLKPPPYEYEFERRPLDLILGDRRIFDGLRQGRPAASLAEGWQADLRNYQAEISRFLLYE